MPRKTFGRLRKWDVQTCPKQEQKLERLVTVRSGSQGVYARVHFLTAVLPQTGVGGTIHFPVQLLSASFQRGCCWSLLRSPRCASRTNHGLVALHLIVHSLEIDLQASPDVFFHQVLRLGRSRPATHNSPTTKHGPEF